MKKYSIVVPTLNERENIVELIQRIENSGLTDFEVVVADENSPDGTAAAVEEYAASGHPCCRVVLNDGIPGLSPSIVKGFSAAEGEYLCCMDGDLQHDVKDLCGLLSELEKSDFAIGSRYVQGGGFAERWNLFRVICSRSAAWMARLILGIRVNDPMSGFFAVRRSVFEEIRGELSPRGFKIMLELLFRLSRHPEKNYRVVEHGITFGLRKHGQSKLSTKVIAQYLQMLLQLRFERK